MTALKDALYVRRQGARRALAHQIGVPRWSTRWQWNRTAYDSLQTAQAQHAAIPTSGRQDRPLSDSPNTAGSPSTVAHLIHN